MLINLQRFAMLLAIQATCQIKLSPYRMKDSLETLEAYKNA